MAQHKFLSWGSTLAIALLPVAGSLRGRQNPHPRTWQRISTGKLLAPDLGPSWRLNSLPVAVALSPSRRYLAILNNGYGTRKSKYRQSIAIFDLRAGRVRDFPDARLGPKTRQTYFLGLAFNAAGNRLYASMASLSDPLGRRPKDTGNGIAVYGFHAGRLWPKRFLRLPLLRLDSGKRETLPHLPPGFANPYPAGLAVLGAAGGERLLVAANYADAALLLDARTGRRLRRFDLSQAAVVPAAFPYGVAVARHGARYAWCSLWNASAVARLDLRTGAVRLLPLLQPQHPQLPGSHPTALLLGPRGRRLYVTLSNRDRAAVLDAASGRILAWFSTRLPGERYAGAQPDALALGRRHLYVADAMQNAVAVFDLANIPARAAATPPLLRAQGFVPTEWYPTALAAAGGKLVIITGKGVGTGPNAAGTRPVRYTYIAKLIHGSAAVLDRRALLARLPALTRMALHANRMDRAPLARVFAGANPIRHVIYIIKENRTYDQVFGDLPGNGDAAYCMYCAAITPNEHALARQFGILDNFDVSAEVSADGHEWSDAAAASDYNEKTWEINYRNGQRPYDFQGSIADAIPLAEGVPNVDEPFTRYLWSDAARAGIRYRIYGEDIVAHWCNQQARQRSGRAGTPSGRARACRRTWIRPGQPLPTRLGADSGHPSPYGWPIPILAGLEPTFASQRGHFDPRYPDFKLNYPDQLRADEFLREFRQFAAGRGGRKLPQLIVLWLPDDHTAGASPGFPRPAASVADNDLALGRIVAAVSHSRYWRSTAIFVLEDDAQNGPDHVDAHRSTALVISAWSPGAAAHPYIEHHFYTTVNMLRTIEVLLGLPPMNNNDARASVMAGLFRGSGRQPPFRPRRRNLRNGLIYRANPPRGYGARRSAAMDFNHADEDNSAVLNAILWHAARGNVPLPASPAGRQKK